MKPKVPEPYRVLRSHSTLVVAAPHAVEWVHQALAEGRTLYDYAARDPGAETLQGRGPVYAIPENSESWVVRHCRRGGAMARWLGDRYLRVGTLRPIRELRASLELPRRGIQTPRIVAVAIYPAGPFYRADVASTRVPRATDLAQTLFEAGSTAGDDRVLACRAAGDLVRKLAEHGILHADLNAKNILLEWIERPPRVHLLDLDACRFVAPSSSWQRARMRRRLWRSLRKWEARSGRPLDALEWEALDRAVRGIRLRGNG